jgi:integrase
MSAELLTRDNLHLSRPTMAPIGPAFGGFPEAKTSLQSILETNLIDAPMSGGCINAIDPDELVAEYVRESISGNTRRAYFSDLAHFENWGGSIPASAETVAAYIAHHAGTLRVATLARHLASISKAHVSRGFPNPAQSELVRATLRGIKRTYGVARHEAKPLLKEDLFAVLAAMGDSTKDMRDKALLLIGIAGGFRRSELVAIDLAHIEHVRQGIVVTIARSKTDQLGEGRKIGIPHGRTRWCPVAALENWFVRSSIADGPIFRPIDRHGRIANERLSGEAVSLVVKERLAGANIDPTGYSGHSLRAGLATSAAQAGVSSFKIRQQTGHASDAMLARYIRDANLFEGNAAASLL